MLVISLSAWQWNCWTMWSLHVYTFKELPNSKVMGTAACKGLVEKLLWNGWRQGESQKILIIPASYFPRLSHTSQTVVLSPGWWCVPSTGRHPDPCAPCYVISRCRHTAVCLLPGSIPRLPGGAEFLSRCERAFAFCRKRQVLVNIKGDALLTPVNEMGPAFLTGVRGRQLWFAVRDV